MGDEDLAGTNALETAIRLTSAAEALAALAAHMRARVEGIPLDPAVCTLLAEIAAELGVADDPGPEGRAVIGMARAFLRQAVELVEDPGRSPGWDRVDAVLLQEIGRSSASIAAAVRAAEDILDGLGARLRRSGARILDVGTGTGWLAIALARAYPDATVTGIDLFAPALELARINVAAAGLTERVELRLQDVTTLDEHEAYDAVWLPMPFLAKEIVPAALDAAARALRPGGWVLPGVFGGPPDRLSELLVALRTVRSGGHPWEAGALLALLENRGYSSCQEVPRNWRLPVRLFAGRFSPRS
jgi:SAM-dependent methyltransferase